MLYRQIVLEGKRLWYPPQHCPCTGHALGLTFPSVQVLHRDQPLVSGCNHASCTRSSDHTHEWRTHLHLHLHSKDGNGDMVYSNFKHMLPDTVFGVPGQPLIITCVYPHVTRCTLGTASAWWATSS